MKKISVLLLIIAYLIVAVPVVSAEDADGNGVSTDSIGCRTLDAEQALLGTAPMVESVQSVVLYETNSQTLMYQWNADERIDPASLVKLMTALIVVEDGTMSDAVTVTSSDLEAVPDGSATVELQVDEVLTVEQLLYCMLVSSANDASIVLARHIAGSELAFVEMMNDRALELGCTNTVFANVHGMYDAAQYTTARDVAKILEAALTHEVFRVIFGTSHYNLPTTAKAPSRYLTTRNHLMSTDAMQVYYDERVTGSRAGMTEDGLQNLASVAQQEEMELICVVLGAESQLADDGYSIRVFGGFGETSTFFTKGFDGMHLTPVTQAGQVFEQINVVNGECDVIVGPAESLAAILPTTVGLADLSYRYDTGTELYAPIEKGEAVTTVEVWYQNVCVAQTQLLALNHVDILQTQAVIDDEQEKNTTVFGVIGIIVGSVILLVILVRMVRKIFRRRSYRRSRQYSRNRRRSQ